MRIVNLETFMRLPAGTLFQKYEPCCFGDLEIKGSWPNDGDFVSACLTDSVLTLEGEDPIDAMKRAENSDFSFSMDLEDYGRDGLYEKDSLFAVYELNDMVALITKIESGVPYNPVTENKQQ